LARRPCRLRRPRRSSKECRKVSTRSPSRSSAAPSPSSRPLTIRPGFPVRVMVTRVLVLEPYSR
jgi:hypothetical protein